MKKIPLGMDGMTINDLVTVARDKVNVCLTKNAKKRIQETRKMVDRMVQDKKTVYGVTTGFGALSDVIISSKDIRILQKNILLSHAAGVGDILDRETVRSIMALRIKDMARGHSGIRLQTVSRIIDLLNHDVSPIVPEKGSVGASGDLVPLAHLSLALIGKGDVFFKGKKITAKTALKKLGMKPLTLEAGEGLALINGTQPMTAISALTIHDAIQLNKLTDIAAAMSLEVLMGSRMEFNPNIQKVRPHPGQSASANNMARITKNSDIITSHKDCCRIQDAYTLRCSPQVHGASRDAIGYARKVVETEMNSSTSNPLFFYENNKYLLGGNFHGQPIALAMDFLCMAVSELANISERRIERLVNPKLSGLPAFLVKDGGLNSGFMIAQYTAAALVSENKVFSHPASVDSIPTSANKEDHVSMGTISARKARDIVKNAENVIAIELLCAAQGLDLFTNIKPGQGTLATYKVIRQHISNLEKDRILSTDIEAMVKLMKNGDILTAVEKAVGKLK